MRFESYGKVSVESLTDTSGMRRRRQESTQTHNAHENPTPSSLFQNKHKHFQNGARMQQSKYSDQFFLHNTSACFLVGFPIISLGLAVLFGCIPAITSRNSVYCLMMGFLIIYAFDLKNSSDGVIVSIWSVFLLVSLSLLLDYIHMRVDDDETGFMPFFRLIIAIFHMFCLTALENLQLSTSYIKHNDVGFLITLEELLFAILPLSFSAITTYAIWLLIVWTPYAQYYVSIDQVWIPYIFTLSLSFSIWLVGNKPSSFNIRPKDQNNFDDENEKRNKPQRQNAPFSAFNRKYALLHASILLLVPSLMHLATMRHRLLFAIPPIQHVYDFVLTITVPILVLSSIKSSTILQLDFPIEEKYVPKNKSIYNYRKHYDANSIFSSITSVYQYVTVQLAPIALIITIIIIQEKFIVEFCKTTSLYFKHGIPNSWAHITIFLIGSYILGSSSYCFKMKDEFKEFAGDFSNDVADVCLIVTFFFLQMALGIPLSATPAIFLSTISLVAYITSRKVRLLLVVIFALIAQMFPLLIQLKFVSISLSSGISLFHFIISCVLAMVILILLIGFVYRAPKGFLSSHKLDFAGILLSSYSILLQFFEATLTNENRVPNSSSDHPLPVYPNYLPPITSLILFVIALKLKQTNAISVICFLAVSCISIVKLLPTEVPNNKTQIMTNIAVANLVLFTFFAPYAFFQPTTNGKTTLSNSTSHKRIHSLEKIIFIYALVILPSAIICSRKTLIEPLVHSLSAPYQVLGQYSLALPTLIGWFLAMWGFAIFSMLAYLLPGGGVESLKKIGVISIFIGILITFTSKSVPHQSKQFISNVTNNIDTTHKKSRWGLVVSMLACLLALTGPLTLCKPKISERNITNLKEPLLARVMIFSVIFGCGIAWFIILEIMADSNLITLTLVAGSGMTIAFLGTALSVLAHFLDLQHTSDLLMFTKLVVFACPMFIFVAGFLSWENSRLFGVGGWLSGLLSICAIFSLTFCLALKLRGEDEKNTTTRELGNLSCFLSWAIVIFLVYGEFGLSRTGASGVMSIIDAPSVFGTILGATILLLLEGGSSMKQIRRYRLSQNSPISKQGRSFFCRLRDANLYLAPFASIATVLLFATLYAIFLRGCVISVQTNYKDVFASVYGSSKITTGVPGEDDVATMAVKKILHSRAIEVAAKLAGSGFCTSEKKFGPLLHLGGTIVVIPSLRNLMMFFWIGLKQTELKIISTLSLNLFPLFICTGLPTLQGLALFGVICGCFQIIGMRNSSWIGKMQI